MLTRRDIRSSATSASRSSDLAAWERFATDVLGLEVADRADDGALALRLDQHRAAHRRRARARPTTSRSSAGRSTSDAALTDLTVKLRAAGVDVTDGTEEEAARRRRAAARQASRSGRHPVGDLLRRRARAAPFVSRLVRSGFVADELGLGHVVVGAHDQAASRQFYCDVLGFRLSDRIVADVYGYPVDIAFLHANPRHHSIAFGGTQKKRIHHFMLEVAVDGRRRPRVRSRRARGRAASCRRSGGTRTTGCSRSTRKTPSGFQFEYGWGGRDRSTTPPGSRRPTITSASGATTAAVRSRRRHERPPRRRRMSGRPVPEGSTPTSATGCEIHYHEEGRAARRLSSTAAARARAAGATSAATIPRSPRPASAPSSPTRSASATPASPRTSTTRWTSSSRR